MFEVLRLDTSPGKGVSRAGPHLEDCGRGRETRETCNEWTLRRNYPNLRMLQTASVYVVTRGLVPHARIYVYVSAPASGSVPVCVFACQKVHVQVRVKVYVYVYVYGYVCGCGYVRVCRVPCAVCRVPCAVCRVPCAVCRVPCAVCRVPS